MPKITHQTILGIVIIFALAGMFGAHFSMLQDERGNMGDCPFMDHDATICQMTIIAHIQAWQMMITAIPQKIIGSLAMLLLFSAIMACTALIAYLYRRLLILALCALFKLSIQRYQYLSFLHHLKEAFSQGILNPRIYA